MKNKSIISSDINYKEIKEDNYLYEFYMKVKKEVQDNNVIPFDFSSVLGEMSKSNRLNLFYDMLNDFKMDILFHSEKHGFKHNLRVAIYAFLICHYEKINDEDFKLIIEGAKYHDTGRVLDNEDREHGLKSSQKIDFLKEKYSEEEINILKSAITCHSLNDNELDEIAKKNNVEDIERCRLILNVLKDSDALDRSRLEYPYIKIDLLRTDTARKLILFAYEFYNNHEAILKNLLMMLESKSNAYKKFNGKLLNIVLKQIENFYEIHNSDYKISNSYNIGDDVKLNSNHLLHGIRTLTDIIDVIADRGVISQDYFEDSSDHAFCYESAFWNVKEDITLKDYIINYSGVVAHYNEVYEVVPYKKLDDFVEKMKNVDHWLWTAESSMEIRFMPSLARNINQIGFILNTKGEIGQKLKSNSVFRKDYNRDYSFEFVNPKHIGKFKENNFKEDYFDRADYLIYGLPRNFIEGILVGREYEKDENMLNKLEQLFPNTYISNLDGKVIK